MILATLLVALLPAATVRGTVRAEATHEPVAYATVRLDDARRSTRTDERGLFVLASVPQGNWRVRISAAGYLPKDTTLAVPASGMVEATFDLRPSPYVLPGIEARGQRESRAASTAGPGATRIEAREIDAAPALAEADVLRTVQLLPSVAAASDFSSALYVRGGSPDQTLVMLDGAPLFNPYHLGGLFGAIDPDAVSAVDVLPGAFPARIGDRLSGIVDIQTRDGGRDRVRGFGGTSLISSRAGLDGPLPGGRGSYLVSARRTYLDLFTRAAYGLELIDVTVPYAFTDAHLKVTHDVGTLGRLSAAVYIDEEGLGYPRERPSPYARPRDGPESEIDFRWGSRVGSLRFRRPLGSTVVAELRGAVSTFHGSFDVVDAGYTEQGRPAALVQLVHARTGMRDLMGGADVTWHARGHQLRGGLQWDAYRFDHDVQEEGNEAGPFFDSFRRADEPTTVAVYVEDEWQPTSALRLRGGVRVLAAGERGTEILPRVGGQYSLTPSLTLTLGAGRSAQVLHSLRSEESLGASIMAYDLMTAVPVETGLSTATDLVGGAEWVRGTTSVRVDAFAKRLSDVPLPPIPVDITEAPVLVNDGYVTGSGGARGLEVLARSSRGRALYALAYALNEVRMEVDGVHYTPRFERRHSLDAVASVPLGRHAEFSSRLALASGQPYTPPAGYGRPLRYDPATGTWVDIHGGAVLLGEHNSGRLPGYFRVDVGLRRSFEPRIFGLSTTVTPFLQIVNVLNTRNVLAGIPDLYGEAGPQITYAPQLPIVPTIGFEWKF